MPRTLYLLRHAKSSWKDASLRDFDRPLKGRGRDAAKQIGKRLADEKPLPVLVVCSSAARTRETAEIVLKHSNLKVDVNFVQRIYEASLRDLLQVVSEIPDDKEFAGESMLSVGNHRRLSLGYSCYRSVNRAANFVPLTTCQIKLER